MLIFASEESLVIALQRGLAHCEGESFAEVVISDLLHLNLPKM